MAEASNPTEAVQQAMMAEFAHLDAGTFEARFVFGVSAGVSSLFVLSRLLAKWISSQGWNFEDCKKPQKQAPYPDCFSLTGQQSSAW